MALTGRTPCETELLACGDVKLLAHDVDSGHELAHRMLDLKPRVQLDEVVRPVGGQQELERSRIEVGDGTACAGYVALHRVARRLVDCRRRGLLDQLLVPPLDRALTLTERQHAAVRIAEDLDLHVPGGRDELLEVQRAVAERRERLRTRAGKGVVEIFHSLDEPHALSSPSGRGLQEDRIPELVSGEPGLDHLDRFRAGNERNAGFGELALRLDLVAHAGHDVDVRPDEHQIVVHAGTDELQVFGQEADTRVNRVATRDLPRRNHRGNVEIALDGGWRSDAHRSIGETCVQRAGISGRIDGDRLDAELVERADDAHRHLTAVRHENSREHR